MDNICIHFEDHELLTQLLGKDDAIIKAVAEALAVEIACRGNVISIDGPKEEIALAQKVLDYLYGKLEEGGDVKPVMVAQALKMIDKKTHHHKKGRDIYAEEEVIDTLKKKVAPLSPHQRELVALLRQKELCFASGPAGTGKTYLAVAVGVSMFINHQVDRIILARPAVEAGEKIGFLPGDMKEKIDPYMQPLYDALHDMMPEAIVKKHIEERRIEVAPLAFMRGRTLRNAFVILDEAQNTSASQMKMFLTRLGEGSRMVINGDLTQIDLPGGVKSGFADAIERLKHVKAVGHVRFNDKDVVRHPLVAEIIKAYEL